MRIRLGSGVAGTIAEQRRPMVLDDVERSDVLNPILRAKGIKSLLRVPLMVQVRVLGVVHVGTLTPTCFSATTCSSCSVADRIAMAIEHANLYEAARRARHDYAEAAEALRMRDDFLGIAAHELKVLV